MKRISVLFLLMTLSLCFAAQPVLETIYFGDYGEICRVVLQFDQKPDFRIERDNAGKFVRVGLNGVLAGSEVQMSQDTPDSRVLDRIEVVAGANGLTVTIRTDGYALAKESLLPGNPYKIVLDIYNVKVPSAIHERLSFARFYYKTGFHKQAIEQYEIIAKDAPTMTGIHYYWGMILKSRKNTKGALQHFNMVKDTASEYAMAQDEIKKVGGKNTPKPEPKATEEKPKTTAAKPVAEPPLPVMNDNIDSLLVQAAHKSVKDPDRLMLAGMAYKFVAENVTKSQDDYKTAISLLMHIPAKSDYSFEKYKALAELYAAIGDAENAKLFAGLATDTGTPVAASSSGGFLQIELKLWIALLLMLLFGIIVFFLLMIYYRNKTSSDVFTNEDFTYHEDLIKNEIEDDNASENEKESDLEDEPFPEVSESVMEQVREPEDEPEERENEAKLYFGDDEPASPKDVFMEETELTQEEEQELMEDEAPEEEIDGLDGSEPRIGDQEYIQKMILKLSQNGWDTEAIAKELKISVREVEFVLKTNE